MAADGTHLLSSSRHVHVGCAARDQHGTQHDWRYRRACQEEVGGKTAPQEPCRIVLSWPQRSTLPSTQMLPDSSAMVNTSLSWVSESPTGGIHRGTISRGLSNFDT